jgi:hypothetical protein
MKIGQMTVGIWLYILCSSCVTISPLVAANGSSFLDWKPSIPITAEDVVDIDKYKLPNDNYTLTLCLYKAALGKNDYQEKCDNKMSFKRKNFKQDLSMLAGDLPTLEAKQICKNVYPKGKEWYIRQQQSKKAEYVLKCKRTEQKKSVILSLKKLCQSQYPPLKSDKKKFCASSICSSSNGNSDLQQQLASKDRELKTLSQANEVLAKAKKRVERENKRVKNEKKRVELELAQAKAKIKELEQASQKPKDCEITNSSDNRITVAIKNYSLLRFVKVNSTYRMGMRRGINIALTDQQANEFHRRAMQLSPHSLPIYPSIFKAVSQYGMRKPVGKFWIQEQIIDPQLYGDIVSGGSADKVSYENAMQVIKTLNDWCQQEKAQFQLPEEKQFVHLAKLAYNPIREGLQPCGVVKERVALDRVKQLFGHQWQLTSSYCSAFDNRACSDEQTRIKKGGSIESQYAAECMPEYRAESMPDIREPNTTFRLVLKLLK